MTPEMQSALQQLTDRAAGVPGLLQRLEAAMAGSKRAAKTWLQQHDQVDTLQFTVKDGQLAGGWHAGVRPVSVRASYARFSSSRRDFAGLIAIGASDEVWIGCSDERELIIYSSQPLF